MCGGLINLVEVANSNFGVITILWIYYFFLSLSTLQNKIILIIGKALNIRDGSELEEIEIEKMAEFVFQAYQFLITQ